MKKHKVVILANENPNDHSLWIDACNDYKDSVDYAVVKLTRSDWFEQLCMLPCDYLLARPPGISSNFKLLYDERIKLIDEILKIPIFPTPKEIYLYENKRFQYSWLKLNNIPHPRTDIFYDKNEAFDFLAQATFPIVAKSNIGASGSGVKIFKDKKQSLEYISSAFSERGITRRWGPNLAKGNLLSRASHYFFNMKDIKTKISGYAAVRKATQQGFVIFQEFVPHTFEWRVVAINNSYFAHKKLAIDGKASGTLLKDYDRPPLYLFDFVEKIVSAHSLTSQAIDLFENENGEFLVNEMQCIFGQSDPYQMLVDGVPGRYFKKFGKWEFEEGVFNKNASFNLRLDSVLELISKSND
ncbi:MAG: hypothetical protein K9I71_03350 [Ignavibacteriales bacterium]|nr:hypothetical protein [Melioribacteraceae bacterium]MCF8315130.1 hypothetical protein [Ignavibacteriales bacterium]MCF8435874.1 hypothetical protein [Ignavibacteriales bacterium]